MEQEIRPKRFLRVKWKIQCDSGNGTPVSNSNSLSFDGQTIGVFLQIHFYLILMIFMFFKTDDTHQDIFLLNKDLIQNVQG